MALDGLRWSRDSGSANCDMPRSAVFGRPGGGNSCYCRSHKRAGAIIKHVITQILLHSGCKNTKKFYTAVTFYNIFCREVGRREGNSLYSTVNMEFIVSSLIVIMNWGLEVGMRHGLGKSRWGCVKIGAASYLYQCYYWFPCEALVTIILFNFITVR